MITKAWGYILIECDEDQHRAYDPMRDVRFDFALAQSVGSRQKLMVIRYNPDAYRIGGKTKSEGRRNEYSVSCLSWSTSHARLNGYYCAMIRMKVSGSHK